MDIWDADANAVTIHELASEDPSAPPGPIALARKILGARAITRIDGGRLLGDAKLFKFEGEYRIAMRKHLSPERLGFAIAHELAEWFYRGQKDPEIERACDLLAAAILAPRPAFQSVIRQLGEDFTGIAEAFRITQTGAALRFGEVTGTPIAVVSPRQVRVRGQISFVWPSEHDIRRVARMPMAGLRKTTFTDDPRRVALTVDAIDVA